MIQASSSEVDDTDHSENDNAQGPRARPSQASQDQEEEAGAALKNVLYGSVKSSVARRLGLLSSTRRITVVVGFPFIASPESPCASEAQGLFLAVNGRTSTVPSRPERGSLAHCQAGILRWPTNRVSQFRPVTWSESPPSSGNRLI